LLVPASDSPLLAIFDHDGVLVDTLKLHQDSWVEHGRRHGLPITASFVHETFGMTNPSIFRKLMGDAVTEAEMMRHSDLKEACYRELAQGKIGLLPGVREVLDALRAAGVRLAIGSSSVRGNLDLTIHECGLDGYFDAIASLEDIRHGKPNPEVFLTAAKKVGIDPTRAVVFEDAIVGVQAAKAAGMRAVGVMTSHPAQALWDGGADEVVENLDGYDVAALIETLKARA
jgi:beta-phosphoglucomutase family hydrolase